MPQSVTPYLIVRDANAAIEFYKKAFGATEGCRMAGPDGKSIMHAQITIGDSQVMMTDENPAWDCRSPLSLGGTPVTIHLYVPDVDATFNQAVAAGATVKMPPQDMFWGDRYGQVTDPFGHSWSIATPKENLTPEQMQQRANEAFKSMPASM